MVAESDATSVNVARQSETKDAANTHFALHANLSAELFPFVYAPVQIVEALDKRL